MRRSARAATRLLVVLLVGLIAAPQVAAAPPPEQNRPAGPFRPTGQKVERRAHVVASDLPGPAATTRPARQLERLPWRPGKAPGGSATPVSPNAPVSAAAAPVEASTIDSHPPIVTPTFNGLASGGPFTSVEPPDPWVAVGPNHIVQVVNTAMRITSRQGQNPTVVSLASFFELPEGSFHADPRVIFDSRHGRWIATEFSVDCGPGDGAVNGRGYIDFAISDTADPRGGWTVYFIQYNDFIPDYPGIGTSTDKVALSGNMFRIAGGCAFTDYVGASLVVLDWGQIKAGVEVPHCRPLAHRTSSQRFAPHWASPPCRPTFTP